MKSYQTSSQLHNFCRTFERDVSKPQLGRLKELIHGIVRGKKAILSEIARQNRCKEEKKSERKQVQQYSSMLSKLPMNQMIFRKLKGFGKSIQKDTPLYFDKVDVSKEFHKSLDKIGTTWDGDKGEPGEGYQMMDLSLPNEIGCTTLYRHLYSTMEEDHKSPVREMEKVLQTLQAAWGNIKGTLFFDREADSNNEIEMLLNYEVSFVVRMQTDRGKRDRWIDLEEGGKSKMMALWRKEAQGMTVWQSKKKRNDKRLVQLQWRKTRKILWDYQGEKIPLWLVWAHRENDPQPAVFLTSRRIESEDQAKKVYHQYFARGGEEAVFKCHKTKLGMELVQLQSIEKVKALMMVYVLVDQYLAKLQQMALEVGSIINLMIRGFLQGTQRPITKWAIIDWYHDEWAGLERQILLFRRRHPHKQNKFQPSLFFNPYQKW